MSASVARSPVATRTTASERREDDRDPAASAARRCDLAERGGTIPSLRHPVDAAATP